MILSTLPLVMRIAESIWKDDPYVTPLYCVDTFPIMNEACWSRFIAKMVGILIIFGACLSKAPVMLNLSRTKSTIGLSRSASYCEVVLCANAALYGYLENHPFTAYGETVALAVQGILIVTLIWKYTTNPIIVSYSERVGIILLFILYVSTIILFLPSSYHYVLVSVNWPVLLYSRGIQIIENIRVQHTGAQSIVTNGLNLVGGLVRIITTIKEVGWDITVLTGFGLAAILNLMLVLQQLYYQKNTTKFIHSLKVDTIKKTE